MRFLKLRLLKLPAAVLVCAAILPSLPAPAATKLRVTPPPPPRRVENTALMAAYPLLAWHRRCEGGYAIEQRPSGAVVTPQSRCWWTRD